jgi:Tol biopolymer transport system component/DNA-binding winged helix-turn-helix (wHTH) protein
MAETQSRRRLVRFGAFEADARTGELRRDGVKLKFSGQPFQVLAILLERPGDVVTREELQKRLWPDTFVDVEHNLNTAVNKIREVLGDSAESPRFVETLPRRGYRFIAPLEPEASEEPAAAVPVPPHKSVKRFLVKRFLVPKRMVMLGVVILAMGAGFIGYKKASTHRAVLQRNLTRLTYDEGLQTEATWSPDGSYIAYSSDQGGKFDIWIQQVSGGNPIQVTKRRGQNWQPDWSPDGKYIAYRSEEGDGGIFVIPALGGAGLERKIATFGYHPRWSPDSSQVLLEPLFTETGFNRIYIAQLDGSPPREVVPEFLAEKKLSASAAAWYPDGKKITVWVASSSPTPGFWTLPITGGPGIKLEIGAAVQKELAQASGDIGAGQQLGEYSFSWSPSGDAIYFETGYRGARNIWKLKVDPETMRAASIDRLTTGPGPDAGAAVSRDGKRLAYSAKSQRIQTWLFPFDARTGQITGDGTAITPPGRTSIDPDISRDGSYLAYQVPHGEKGGLSNLDVRNEVWVKSLVDGSEAPVIADQEYSRWFARWSPDGTRLAYGRRNLKTNERQLMVWSRQTHDEEPFAAPNTFEMSYDWSPDGKWLLDTTMNGILLAPVAAAPHLETAIRTIPYDGSEYFLYQTRLSPDGRWIVFEAVAKTPKLESALYVIPVAGGTWTRITDGRHWDDKPRWSPDGRTIYFISGIDGFFNVWGIRFDPTTGKPVGQPFKLSKFDRPRLMIPRWIPPVGFSLTQDKFVLTMAQESGNIWVLDNDDR